MGALLQGRSAIVTGAGRGIGRAIALGLAAEGASVVVNDVGGSAVGEGFDESPAQQVAAEIGENGGNAVPSYDSVADFRGAAQIIQTAVDAFGKVDILVNNAGIFRESMFDEMSEEEWDAILGVHLKGTFNTCRHAVPRMKAQGYGRIINMTSNQWSHPTGRAHYAAAKGAIVSVTWSLAWELRKNGISVNSIAPRADTRSNRDTGDFYQRLSDAGLLPQDRVASIYEVPGAEHVAPMAAYLSSELADGVSGWVFYVGGGEVSLYTHPTRTRSIYKSAAEGPWSVGELVEALPRTILAGKPRPPHIPAS